MLAAVASAALNDDPCCGDAGAWWNQGATTTLCIADGLGHGKHAQTAALAALTYVEGHLELPLVDVLTGCNRALRGTRGVAMGLASIDMASGQVTYAGVGNTRMMVFGSTQRSFCSAFGIVGGGHHKLFTEAASLAPTDLLLMFTDGLPDTVRPPETRHDSIASIAQATLDRWKKGTDDAAVLAFARCLP